MSRTIRVFIVDDSVFARAELRSLLARDPTFEVVGEARDGVGALRGIPATSPDLVLMDMDMPGQDGLAVTRELMCSHPRPILIVSDLVGRDASLNFPRAGGRRAGPRPEAVRGRARGSGHRRAAAAQDEDPRPRARHHEAMGPPHLDVDPARSGGSHDARGAQTQAARLERTARPLGSVDRRTDRPLADPDARRPPSTGSDPDRAGTWRRASRRGSRAG
ncbi:MAG: response regulator [Sandaracinaceae bacterium]|nr:response regulator [Sandaracinaceae bacterium]